MKLKTIITAATLSTAFIGTNASASLLFDIYAGPSIGVGGARIFTSNDNFKQSSQSYGAVVGIDIPALRFELEYDYLNGQESQLQVGMINAYVKILPTMVQPYIGAGIGNVFTGKVRELDTKVNSGTAYQAMAGITVNVPILPLKIDAEARALYAPDIYETLLSKPDLLHYDARVKLRYIF